MRRIVAASLIVAALFPVSCGGDGDTLTVYSGRKQEIVEPLLSRFEEEAGIHLEVRYADSVDLAATLREEGENTPADVFFSIDPASLGAVAEAGLFRPLPADVVAVVPARFADPEGRWVGTSGRSRSVVYDSDTIRPEDLPTDLDGFIDPAWRGRLGIAPGNGSFVASVAAMILIDGEAATRDWLRGLAANDPITYPKNSVIVAAVDEGEIDVGLVNHYYALQRAAETGSTAAANHFLAGGPGALVMPAGVGILRTSDQPEAAEEFVAFLLSETAQRFFVEKTFEYPVTGAVSSDPSLPPLDRLSPPDLDLSRLAGALDLATDLIAEAGLL